MNLLEDSIILELTRVIKSYKLEQTLNHTSFENWLAKASANILGRASNWLSVYLGDPAPVLQELAQFKTKAKKTALKQRLVEELAFADPEEAAFVMERMFPQLMSVIATLLTTAETLKNTLDAQPFRLNVTTKKGTGKLQSFSLVRGDLVNGHEAWTGGGLKLKVEEVASELTWKLMKGTTKLATAPYTGTDTPPEGPWKGTTKVQVKPAM